MSTTIPPKPYLYIYLVYPFIGTIIPSTCFSQAPLPCDPNYQLPHKTLNTLSRYCTGNNENLVTLSFLSISKCKNMHTAQLKGKLSWDFRCRKKCDQSNNYICRLKLRKLKVSDRFSIEAGFFSVKKTWPNTLYSTVCIKGGLTTSLIYAVKNRNFAMESQIHFKHITVVFCSLWHGSLFPWQCPFNHLTMLHFKHAIVTRG
jgi:hypothetical protein